MQMKVYGVLCLPVKILGMQDGSPRIQSLFKWRLDQNSDIAKIYELHNTQYKRAKHTCGRHETKSDEIRTDNQPDQKAMRTPLDR